MVNGRYSMEKDDELTEKFFDDLKNKLISMGHTGSLTGEVVRFPVGDGAAVYMVAEGSTTFLVHCPIGDAWSIPEAHARGLRKSDIRDMIRREQRMRDLFSRRS